MDVERGLVSREFVDTLGEAQIQVFPIAGQAHWQHGKIERHGAVLKDMIGRVVNETQAKGEEEMNWVAVEAAAAKNMLSREHGFSPSQLLFGREPKSFGEVVANGEPCAMHFRVSDPQSQVAKRMKYRYQARKAYLHFQASHLMNQTARNKTRPWSEPQIGDKCFFFRETKEKRVKGKSGKWIGPALVVGLHGHSNVWVAYGGKCILVAQEHTREAIGEELLFGRPEVQEALQLFGDHRKDGKFSYEDLTQEKGLGKDTAMDEPDDGVVDDLMEEFTQGSADSYPRVEEPPQKIVELAGCRGEGFDEYGNPTFMAFRSYGLKIPSPKYTAEAYPFRSTWGRWDGVWRLIEDEVKWTS